MKQPFQIEQMDASLRECIASGYAVLKHRGIGTPAEQIELTLFGDNEGRREGQVRLHRTDIDPDDIAREIVRTGDGFARFADIEKCHGVTPDMDAATLAKRLRDDPNALLSLCFSLQQWNGLFTQSDGWQTARVSDILKDLGHYRRLGRKRRLRLTGKADLAQS